MLQGTTTVGFLLPGKSATLQSNGTTWIATGEGQSQNPQGQTYIWGGNTAAGNFLHVWNEATTNNGISNVDAQGAFHQVVEAGTIDF